VLLVELHHLFLEGAGIPLVLATQSLHLRGDAPPAVFAQLVHATRAGHDVRLRLAPAPGGVYEAELPPLAAGHWRLVLEDPRGEWRVTRELP